MKGYGALQIPILLSNINLWWFLGVLRGGAWCAPGPFQRGAGPCAQDRQNIQTTAGTSSSHRSLRGGENNSIQVYIICVFVYPSYLYLYLCICVSVLSVSISVTVHPSLSLSVYPSIFIYVCDCVSVLSVSISDYPAYLFLYSIFVLSVSFSEYTFYLYLNLFIHLICILICVSGLSVSLSVCSYYLYLYLIIRLICVFVLSVSVSVLSVSLSVYPSYLYLYLFIRLICIPGKRSNEQFHWGVICKRICFIFIFYFILMGWENNFYFSYFILKF